LAAALQIPFADLSPVADWLAPQDLSSLLVYLRAKYGLDKRAAAEIDTYLTARLARHGNTSDNGPMNAKDEH